MHVTFATPAALPSARAADLLGCTVQGSFYPVRPLSVLRAFPLVSPRPGRKSCRSRTACRLANSTPAGGSPPPATRTAVAWSWPSSRKARSRCATPGFRLARPSSTREPTSPPSWPRSRTASSTVCESPAVWGKQREIGPGTAGGYGDIVLCVFRLVVVHDAAGRYHAPAMVPLGLRV